MDKNIYSKQTNKVLLKDQSDYKVSQSVATKNNDNNVINYKNIFLTMPGEISSGYIHRNNLTQNNKPNVSFMEGTEDNDEQFILNMKQIIDKNCNIYNKENYGIRNLQSRSSKKKKGVFTDEDQNLMKRFKKSMDDNKPVSVIPQNLQQSVTPANNPNSLMRTSIPLVASTFASNIINKTPRNNTNQLLHVTSKIQKDNQLIVPETAIRITEREIEELVYCEMQYLRYCALPREDYTIYDK